MTPRAALLLSGVLVLALLGCSQPWGEGRIQVRDLFTGPASRSQVTDEVFTCEADDSIRTRGYVWLMGLGDGAKTQVKYFEQERLMKQDPKAVFVEFYPQDPSMHLPEISDRFILYMEGLLSRYEVDELVLFGSSAGGVTASYSISRLPFDGPVALHTMASPLRGYDLTGFRARFLGDRTGFLRDIAVGFGPFEPPGGKVRVYHHKTVTDEGLLAYCKEMKEFCDVLRIQDNNLRGSREFYYPQYDHITIMRGVARTVLACYNITEAQELAKLPADRGLSDKGLGLLCNSEEWCTKFCMSNLGQCRAYCADHPENQLCQKPFAFETSPGQV